jgi:uncharacterized membrane protein YqjE
MAETPNIPPSQPPPIPPDPSRRGVGELFLDVSERTTAIIREEIELAKAEVTEKVTKLLRGGAVGAAAGTFAFLALIMILVGLSFLIDDLLFDDTLWPGFLIVAGLLLLLAALAGWLAYRSIQAGSPPVPEQAIEDVKQTRAVLERSAPPAAAGAPRLEEAQK